MIPANPHEQITLRATHRNECEMLFPIFSDETIVQYTYFLRYDNVRSLGEFLDRFLNINLHEPLQYGPYSIYLNDTIIGLCGAQQKDMVTATTELWYILHKDYWGKGLATKAVELVMKECKSNKQLKSIYAEAVNINPGSWKILEGFGFTKTREVKNGFSKGDILEDLKQYSYDCREFPNLMR
jgi:ribosomal-protein-alanine N-acetyltransferase